MTGEPKGEPKMLLSEIPSNELKGKKVLLRTNFDLPLDATKSILDPAKIKDYSRIKDCLPTLEYLLQRGAKVIMLAGWMGRPDGEDAELSMAPAALRLQQLLEEDKALKHPVLLAPNCLDGSKPRSVYKNQAEVINAANAIAEGQVLVLENVRFDAEANANDAKFAEFIASLAGPNALYVNEAEAQNHRPEATVATVPIIVAQNGGNAVLGFNYAEVAKYLGGLSQKLSDPARGKFSFFLTGKKIETTPGITSKITVAFALLEKMKKADVLVVQGAVAYTFLVAQEFIESIRANSQAAETIIANYNAKIKQETKAIKNDGAPNASERAADAQKKLETEKSNELKNLFGITDEKIKALVGGSYIDWKQTGEQTYFAAKVFFKAEEKQVETIVALDHAITDKFPDKSGMLPTEAQIKLFGNPTGIPQGWLGVAPGPKTAKLIADKTQDSELLIMAGPLCIEEPRVEQLSQANKIVFEGIRIAKEKGGITVGAGGDTAAAIRQNKGENAFTLISNAGGATLELIEKGTSVGLDAVQKASEIWKQKNAQ